MAKSPKRRRRGRRRLADLSINPAEDSFKTYREDAECRVRTIDVNFNHDRLIVREWRDEQNGALSDFVLVQQAFDLESGEWRDVALIDAKHGTVHIHRFRRNGAKLPGQDIESYSTREELEALYQVTEDRLFNTWEENRRWWSYQG